MIGNKTYLVNKAKLEKASKTGNGQTGNQPSSMAWIVLMPIEKQRGIGGTGN
jgi:hypothetical protein